MTELTIVVTLYQVYAAAIALVSLVLALGVAYGRLRLSSMWVDRLWSESTNAEVDVLKAQVDEYEKLLVAEQSKLWQLTQSQFELLKERNRCA